MQTAYVVNKGTVLDVCGPTVEFLNSPEETDAVYCIMIGTIPPGVSVPLHSHPDVESFFTLSGTVQVLFQREDRFEWIDVKIGRLRPDTRRCEARISKHVERTGCAVNYDHSETRKILSRDRQARSPGRTWPP